MRPLKLALSAFLVWLGSLFLAFLMVGPQVAPLLRHVSPSAAPVLALATIATGWILALGMVLRSIHGMLTDLYYRQNPGAISWRRELDDEGKPINAAYDRETGKLVRREYPSFKRGKDA